MKICFKCGATRPLSEFYKHPKMADGHVNKCKECNKKDVHENYVAKFEQYRAYEQGRAKFPHRLVLNTATVKRIRAQFPNKYKAQTAIGNAVRTGQIRRMPCERCGSLRVHGHHEDYSKPLEVMWLCPKHHKERHRELDAMN